VKLVLKILTHRCNVLSVAKSTHQFRTIGLDVAAIRGRGIGLPGSSASVGSFPVRLETFGPVPDGYIVPMVKMRGVTPT
jgi:hypothetical protein